jgi:hypothetical protein
MGRGDMASTRGLQITCQCRRRKGPVPSGPESLRVSIADQRKPVQSTIVPQQVEIDDAFSIRRENELPRVAALCHMVRGGQSDDACESSHEQKVPQSHETGNVPSGPGFPFDTDGSRKPGTDSVWPTL